MDGPRSFGSFLNGEVKLLQPLCFKHSEHVGELAPRYFQHQAERGKVRGLQQAASVGSPYLYRGRCHDHDDAGPGKAGLRHGEGGRYELDGLSRWSVLDDLPEINRAASEDFAPASFRA